MDTAFVTGGTGFVGANLVRLLLEKGLKVRVLARKGNDRASLAGLGLDIQEGELLDREALRAGCAGARYVFHLAADYRLWTPDPRGLYAANVDGTRAVLRAAREAGVERTVHCSSVATLRPSPDRRPADEDAFYPGPEGIVSDYKKSKYLAEAAALEAAASGQDVVIVNPAAPIGPWDSKPTPTGRIVTDFLNGRMPSYLDTGLNVVHAADAALGHWLAALGGRPGRRYILGGENLTLKQILDLLSECSGLPAPSLRTPYAVAYLYGALGSALARLTGSEPRAPLEAVRMARHYMWFDSGRARRELGYSPRPAREALADAVAWFQERGYAPRPAGAAA